MADRRELRARAKACAARVRRRRHVGQVAGETARQARRANRAEVARLHAALEAAAPIERPALRMKLGYAQNAAERRLRLPLPSAPLSLAPRRTCTGSRRPRARSHRRSRTAASRSASGPPGSGPEGPPGQGVGGPGGGRP